MDSGVSDNADFTYLVIGLDDAGNNTDVMMLVRYVSLTGSVTFIQIPRDTYISVSTPQNKINQIYAAEISRGTDSRSAMSVCLATISNVFGIRIDGYIAYTTRAFVSFIDAISGINLNMPFDLTFSDGERDITLNKGDNHLDGTDALSLVRYRKGYAMGDLGRIDAQKILINSIVRKFKSSANVFKLLTAFWNNKNELQTNVKAKNLFDIALKNRGRMKNLKFEYMTLPGAAVKDNNGIWYFSVNKNAMQTFYDEREIQIEFDKNNLLCNYNSYEFKNIYFTKTINPVIYDEHGLDKIKIYRTDE